MCLKRFAPLLLILALPLAHATQAAIDIQPAPTPSPADTVVVSKGQTITLPPAATDKAQVVFFRSWRLLHAATVVDSAVRDGDQVTGVLTNGSYFVRQFEPGVHEFSVKVAHKDRLKLNLEPGKTYYVRETVRVGFVLTRPYLNVSDLQTFNKLADEIESSE